MALVLRAQADACANLGSPFMGQLLYILSDSWKSHGTLADFCGQFEGDLSASGYSLPLRLAAALHALVMSGRDPDLAMLYPPNYTSDADLEETVWRAIDRHQEEILDWMTFAPQTNEVRRSTVLIPAAHWIAARHPLPFVTSELGASAGLNMAFDQFAIEANAGRLGPENPALTLRPEWTGDFPAASRVEVAERAGVDLNPLDPHEPEQQLRLLSYLWPDQPHRVALTKAAIAVRADPVHQGDAIEWLEQRLASPRPGRLHLVYHTIAWQYFPAASQTRATELMEAAGAAASDDAPLAWLQFEADGNEPGGGIFLRLWPGNVRIALGRADYHGRWVKWGPRAI
ncbi:MAG: DUF2332 domain-containing protein [Paracoccaceae bacterium]